MFLAGYSLGVFRKKRKKKKKARHFRTSVPKYNEVDSLFIYRTYFALRKQNQTIPSSIEF